MAELPPRPKRDGRPILVGVTDPRPLRLRSSNDGATSTLICVIPSSVLLLGIRSDLWPSRPRSDLGARADGFSFAELPGNVDVLGAAEAFVNACSKSLGTGRADGSEGDFQGVERRAVFVPLDAIESGDGDVFRNTEAFLFERVDQVIGLVVCGADPSGDSLFRSFEYFLDSCFGASEGAGEDADEILGKDYALQSGHFLNKGAVTTIGPGGGDGIILGVKADTLVAGGGEILDGSRDTVVVVYVDTIDSGGLDLVHGGDHREAFCQLGNDGRGEGVDEENAASAAVLEAGDFLKIRVGEISGIWRNKVDVDEDIVDLGIFGDAHEDFFTGAFVVLAEVFLSLTANEHAEVGLLFLFSNGGAPAFEVSVSNLGSQLKNFGACDGTDSGVIGEAS